MVMNLGNSEGEVHVKGWTEEMECGSNVIIF